MIFFRPSTAFTSLDTICTSFKFLHVPSATVVFYASSKSTRSEIAVASCLFACSSFSCFLCVTISTDTSYTAAHFLRMVACLPLIVQILGILGGDVFQK